MINEQQELRGRQKPVEGGGVRHRFDRRLLRRARRDHRVELDLVRGDEEEIGEKVLRFFFFATSNEKIVLAREEKSLAREGTCQLEEQSGGREGNGVRMPAHGNGRTPAANKKKQKKTSTRATEALKH